MFRTARFLLPLAMLGLAACSGSSGPDNTATPLPPPVQGEAKVQVLHASPDAPAVNVSINTLTYSNVDYRSGTALETVPNNTYTIRVDGILPDGTVTVIGPLQLTMAANMRYSIIAAGDVASIEPIVITQPETPVAAGAVRLTVAHAAPMAPEVDVYVTAPGADLSTSAPVGTFAFGGSLGPVEIAAGEYQLRVTVAGDASAVAFDSGPLTLDAGADLLLSAVENTVTGAAPINIVVQDGTGSSILLDAGTPADIRVVHASPDAPNVDVIANDDFANPLIADLAFPSFTEFLSVPPATYNIKVVDSATQGVIAIDANLALAAGIRYDVLAVDNLASIEALIATDDARPVATEAKVRIIHASPAAQNVDIYVTTPGTALADVDPTLPNVPFKANTGYLSLLPGDYEVTVTATGSKNAAIGPAAISISGGGVYTAIARDAAGGGAPLNLILMDDFAL